MNSRRVGNDTETEGFGVSYDRYVMLLHHGLLVKELGLTTVLEMPSYGSKSAPSLYSLGFAAAGCRVTITDLDERMKRHWEELGLIDRLTVHGVDDYRRTGFPDNGFDLSWNFVTFARLTDVQSYLREMIRVSRRYVMLVANNSLQSGYPWHRLLHRLYRFPWTHGETLYHYPWKIKKLMRENGLKIRECGTIDSPPWPDPVGFRDVRLHRKGQKKIEYDWSVPMVDYVKRRTFPFWMRLLAGYDLPLRRGYVKLPFSHLFYVLGEKVSE